MTRLWRRVRHHHLTRMRESLQRPPHAERAAVEPTCMLTHSSIIINGTLLTDQILMTSFVPNIMVADFFSNTV